MTSLYHLIQRKTTWNHTGELRGESSSLNSPLWRGPLGKLKSLQGPLSRVYTLFLITKGTGKNPGYGSWLTRIGCKFHGEPMLIPGHHLEHWSLQSQHGDNHQYLMMGWGLRTFLFTPKGVNRKVLNPQAKTTQNKKCVKNMPAPSGLWPHRLANVSGLRAAPCQVSTSGVRFSCHPRPSSVVLNNQLD